MITNAVYINFTKFLTMALVLSFTAYVANANEVFLDLQPFPACTSCFGENNSNNIPAQTPDILDLETPVSEKHPETKRMRPKLISVAVLNPDLVDFESVRFAIVEVADLEIAAEYLSYSLEDINHDDQTDIVFYFSTQDLIPPNSSSTELAHDTCLIVDILKTDKTIKNYSLCENAILIGQENI